MNVSGVDELAAELLGVPPLAGADRPVAERIVRRLKAAGLRVFYDRGQQHFLLGENLAVLLHTTYYVDSRFAVVVVSRAYLESKWAGNALPYAMEDVPCQGLSPTLGRCPKQVASMPGMSSLEAVLAETERLVLAKLGEEPTGHDWWHADRVRATAVRIAEMAGSRASIRPGVPAFGWCR